MRCCVFVGHSDALLWLLVGLVACCWLCCLVIEAVIGAPLRFVRVRDPYLWLAGASPAFLNRLPTWASGT
jgi:hypothetical protein